MEIEEKTILWKPVSEYTGGRVLATNGLDILVGELNPEGDCVSEDCSGTHLCGITHFAKIDGFFPELKESEDERIRKELLEFLDELSKLGKNTNFDRWSKSDCADWICWLEKQGEQKPTLPKWKYKNDNTPLLRDSIILNKYGCVAKSPSGALVSDVWVIDYDELIKLPKEEIEKQDEQKPADKYNIRGIKSKHAEGKLGEMIKEMKSANKIEPKFKVGDIIKPKDGGHEPWQIMQVDVFDKKYRFKDGYVVHFSQEEDYELIDQKFKVGDWVVKGDTIAQILDIQEQYYVGLDINGKDFTSSRFLNDDKIHLWTIRDAKDGDVLAYSDGSLSIFRYRLSGLDKGCYMAYALLTDEIEVPQTCAIIGAYPATKEQRDLLFQRMKEKGYEWDAEKKELKKINTYCQENCKGFQETGRCFADGECKAKKEYIEQKHNEWSEEDEKERKRTVGLLEGWLSTFKETNYAEDCKRGIEWLKSLKDRVQPKQEWSEEDKDYYDAIITKLEVTKDDALLTDNQMEFLKSLKDKIQVKQEWSEEDEKMVESLYGWLDTLVNYIHHDAIVSLDLRRERMQQVEQLKTWLKSLRPKKQWKPTEEQLTSLTIACDRNDKIGFVLTELLKDLKKL